LIFNGLKTLRRLFRRYFKTKKMDNFDLYKKIEAYLKGELSADAAQVFEQEIGQNPDLAEQVALHRLEWDAMEVLVENDLRDKMATWKKPQTVVDTNAESTVVKPMMTVQKGGLFTRYAWAAAASVAVLVTVGFWFLNRPDQKPENMTRTDQPQNQPVTPIDTMEELDGAAIDTAQNGIKKGQSPDSTHQRRDTIKR
jgi:anti-sigma-K factor RskA